MSIFKSEQNLTGSNAGVEEILPPPECRVIFYNDDFTTKDFVVHVLINVFNKSHKDAEFLMETVHNTGSAIVGSYTYDIAVSRANMAKNLARKNNYPLRVEIEQDRK